jgi:hypothetical protein
MAEHFVDTELGEMLHENEEQITRQIAEAIAAKVEQGPRPALRDAHPKAHGIVSAEFRVNDHLPPQFAQGIFVPGKRYKAWIRFSNASPNAAQPDAMADARGMAIKLLDVQGEAILPDDHGAKTQDFIMVNFPVFFIDNPANYLALIHRSGSSNPLAKVGQLLALGIKGAIIAKEVNSSKIASPLETRYWSMVPYRLGDPPHKQAIKFSARPRLSATSTIPGDPSPNFLRERLIQQLAEGEASFDFEIQPRTSADMSVEDPTIEWDENDAPFFKVATITIPKQSFATPERDQFGENLSFSPWHALPQHRPLGAVNRVRHVVYQTISDLRRKLNDSTFQQPAAASSEIAVG